jgi:hypothetical protein
MDPSKHMPFQPVRLVGAVGIETESQAPKVKQGLLDGSERLKFYTPIWEEF